MSAPAYWSSWTRLRSAVVGREWLTMRELVAAVMACEPSASQWRVQRTVRRMPKPPSRYGMYQFNKEHVAVVVAAVREQIQGGNHDRRGAAAASVG